MPPGTRLAALAAEAAGCTRCPLAATRTQVVFGVGDPTADLMFVGEAPGRDEDLQGDPFVGRSGQLLDRLLAEELGVGPRAGLHRQRGQVPARRTTVTRGPRRSPPAGRTSRPSSSLIAPAVVVTLGNFATKLLLDTDQGITKLRGRSYPVGGRQLVPTFHPAAALRSAGSVVAQMRADLVRAKQLLGPAP